jgi:hypothetical protein
MTNTSFFCFTALVFFDSDYSRNNAAAAKLKLFRFAFLLLPQAKLLSATAFIGEEKCISFKRNFDFTEILIFFLQKLLKPKKMLGQSYLMPSRFVL